MPPDLPKSYDRILDRVNRSSKENQRLVKHTLLWIAYAVEPLTTTQLLQALAVRPGDNTFENENTTTLDELLKWCSSLIRKRSHSDGLELAHFTVKEYLLSLPENPNPELSQYGLTENHAELAKTCLNPMALSKFNGKSTPLTEYDSYNAPDFNKAWRDFENEYPFMQYLISLWTKHVHRSSCSELTDKVLLLLNESSSSYRLWTFGQFLYYPFYHEDQRVDFLSYRLPSAPVTSLGFAMKIPRPSAIHWAAILALPDVCTALIAQVADVNALSVFGNPIQCAILSIHAIFFDGKIRGKCHDDWLQKSQERVIKDLIVAGAISDNVDITWLLYANWSDFRRRDNKLIQLMYNTNPSVSFESLMGFLEAVMYYHGFIDSPGDVVTIEFLRWGVRTNFAHLAPEILPIILTSIVHGLENWYGLSEDFQFLSEIDCNKLSPGYDKEPISNNRQGHIEDWAFKSKVPILQSLHRLRKKGPHFLEIIFMKVVATNNKTDFVVDMIATLNDNNTMLDLAWQNPDKTGNTILLEIVQKTLKEEKGCLFSPWILFMGCISGAVELHKDSLTTPNDHGITVIELLVVSQLSAFEIEWLREVWEMGKVSSAFNRLPDLPKRLLHAATNSPGGVKFVFDQLAKDGNTHWGLLRDFSADHCTRYFLQDRFRLWLEKKNEQEISLHEEAYSDGTAGIVEDDEDSASQSTGRDAENIFATLEEVEETISNLELSEGNNYMENIQKGNFMTIQPSAPNESKHTDVHLLTGSFDSIAFENLRLSLRHGLDLEARNGQGFTPLTIAMRIRNIRAMYALLMAGAEINHRVHHGQTYLHLACCLGNKEAIWALLEAGADSSLMDDDGHSAEELAVLMGRPDIVNLFSAARDGTL